MTTTPTVRTWTCAEPGCGTTLRSALPALLGRLADMHRQRAPSGLTPKGN
ncbi:hypothetical protein [Streptomyces globosus]|nr:hypothetical protein [Streptomyces globosus]